MADEEEEEGGQSLRVMHTLLVALKTTVEGLLATHSSNVWSTYGGLTRTCRDMEKILSHRLKFVVGDYGSAVDFWPFVKGLKWLNPVMTPFIEQISKSSHHGDSKGQVWIRESLKDHTLCSQLKVLVRSRTHMHRHYYEDAFLFDEEYFLAMCTCLQAIEENKVTLLADINPRLLSYHKSTSLTRSASLPVSRATSKEQHRGQRSSNSETLALAPPFTSPSKESILCTSDEHAVPVSYGSSPDVRTAAKDALRNVLRKSGSDSPTGLSNDSFSFYDKANCDPLLNMDFMSTGVSSTETLNQEDKAKDMSERPNKMPIQRSTSDYVISKRAASRRASEMMDKILVEDDVFQEHLQTKSKDKTLARQSRVIFSDSENLEQDEETRLSPKKSSSGRTKHTHKRSRSDISGIKTNSTAVQDGETAVDGSQKLGESLPPPSHFDDVDSARTGLFRQPTQGQSLLHYLSSHDFHTCANLDKENAHFSISEALIAAIEQMKWNHIIQPQGAESDQDDGESDEEIKELKQRIRLRKRERLKEKARGFPAFSDGRTDTSTASPSHSRSASPFSSPHDSEYSTDSSDTSGVDDDEIELTMEGQDNLTRLSNSGLSLSLASLYSDADIQRKSSTTIVPEKQSSVVESSSSHLSAESVAISLLKKFSEKQLPKASDLQWLVTEQEAPQALLPLPNSYPISPDDAENRSTVKGRTRIRGNLEWAPPRQQIIFNIHPTIKRSVLLAKQNYRCTGCGMKVEPGYAKRYRYCEYMGKYFCQCCHSNSTAYIPGRILKKWDFTKYYVSNFARDLLTKIYDDPLFNILDINLILYRKVRALENVRDCRNQLYHVSALLQMCKHAASLAAEIKKMPHHWTTDFHVYSLSDLVSIRAGHILAQLRGVVTSGIQHIHNCQFCQCFGFICEMCKNQKDIIFPFQLQKVTICPDCKTCFHKACFEPQKCPKCARIEARKQRLQEESFDEENTS